MANGAFFKTAFKGYNRNEVVEYISGLNRQMRDLQTQLEQKDAQISRLQEDLEALRQVEQKPSDDEIEQIRQEAASQTAQEYEQKIDALREELEQLKKGTDYVAVLEKKATEYEQYKDSLTELMIQARKSADDLIKDAKREADEIRARAQTQFGEFSAGFGALKENIGATKNDIQRNLDDAAAALNVFDLRLSMIQKNIDEAGMAFAEKKTEENIPQE